MGIEKSLRAEKLLVSFLQGGSKLIKSLLNAPCAATTLRLPSFNSSNETGGLSSFTEALGIQFEGIPHPLQPPANSKTSKSKSKHRSESKSESTAAEIKTMTTGAAKSSPSKSYRSDKKVSKTKSKEITTVKLNISKIVCKDGTHYFQEPTIQLSFGQWKHATSAQSRVNDELVVAG